MLWITTAGFVLLACLLVWLFLRASGADRHANVCRSVQPCDAETNACAFLIPLTDEARAAAFDKNIPIGHYPFRVGRESRIRLDNGGLISHERRSTGAFPNNDAYLLDTAEKLEISREHFQIVQCESGGFELVDRGSACGTRVGSKTVGGGDRGGRCRLKPGDIITIGTNVSPYVFRFWVTD